MYSPLRLPNLSHRDSSMSESWHGAVEGEEFVVNQESNDIRQPVGELTVEEGAMRRMSLPKI